MLIDGIIAFCKAEPTISALVVDRVYEDVLDRGKGFPAIVVHQYNGTQDYEMDGAIDLREDNIQFDVYGSTRAGRNAVLKVVRAAFLNFKGTLTDEDSTVVTGCFLEREMAMPFLPNADKTGLGFRSLLGFRVVSKQ